MGRALNSNCKPDSVTAIKVPQHVIVLTFHQVTKDTGTLSIGIDFHVEAE